MTAAEFRRLALAFPDASESSHMSHPDFRVSGKIFATLGPKEEWGMVKLTPEQQAVFVRTEAEVFQPVNGGWGRRGCTHVRLAHASEPAVRQALFAAWQNTAPKSLAQQFANERAATAGRSATAPRKDRSRRSSRVTFETVRRLSLALPGVVEGTSYGTPAFKVRGKLFVRLHQSGESIVVRIDRQERDQRMQADPRTFYITDHYLKYPMMLVRLSSVLKDDLRELLEESWRRCAPKRLIAEYDASRK